MLAAALLALGPRTGSADAVRITSPTGGIALVAGQLVEVRWEGLPSDADELELLLEVDHSAAVHIRLTPQLAPISPSYLWRVPNLPTRDARLRLRWGRNGLETEGEPGPAFVIITDPATPMNGARFHRGEWWLAAAPFSPLDVPWHGIGRSFDLHLEHPQPATASVVEEIEPGSSASRHEPAMPRDRTRGATAAVRPEVSARRPLTIPLRP